MAVRKLLFFKLSLKIDHLRRRKTCESWNSPKRWIKNLRTIVGARWWTRRYENGAFDTENFR